MRVDLEETAMRARPNPVTAVIAITAAATMAALLLATAASAQPAAAASAAGATAPRAGAGVRWGQGVTPGWSLMTPKERDEHRARMRAATTAQACRELMAEHRALMQKRAEERGRGGQSLMPHRDPCSNWRR
jgi:hypothetical protein